MKILNALAVMLLAPSLFAAEPTSEIPLKREFPLSEKIKPCDDFHGYVCAEAEAGFKLRDDRSKHTFSFNDSSERILEAKKDFFANIQKQKNLSARSQQVKDFYLACMNAGAGKKSESAELKRLVSDMAKITSVGEFADYQVKAMQSGDSSLIDFGAGPNQDEPKISDIYVMVNFMNLPEYTYYENAELMADYRSLIKDFFKIIDPKQTEAQLSERADRMIAFEKENVKDFPHPEVIRQRWSEKRQEAKADFIKKYPHLALKNFFDGLPAKSVVSNPLPEGLAFYNAKLVQRNLPVLKDFYLYAYGGGILDDSQPEYFKKKFEFNAKHLGGAVVRPVRHERCTKSSMNAFLRELDQLLMKKLFPDFPEAKFKNVAAKIRESIITGLKNNTWLGPETKAKAILKMQTAKLYLVKPETEKEWDFLPVRKYSSKDKIRNSKWYSKLQNEKSIRLLRDGSNLEAWTMGPLTVNAYYDQSSNKFVMPLGILQYPFFNADGDLIENLGAVGAVIGHELGHGIDDQGSKYDETGKLSQWMSMQDLKQFTDRGRKMVDQFNKAGHNGLLTIGENIGDLVGLTFAYQAAFPDGKATPEDQRKLFVAYGRLWCGIARPKTEEAMLKTDPHALGRARINEQVKHQPAFAEAFACKPGDKMTLPESDRVKIW